MEVVCRIQSDQLLKIIFTQKGELLDMKNSEKNRINYSMVFDDVQNT